MKFSPKCIVLFNNKPSPKNKRKCVKLSRMKYFSDIPHILYISEYKFNLFDRAEVYDTRETAINFIISTTTRFRVILIAPFRQCVLVQ